MEEIQLPLGLQNLLEREACRRNCTVSALVEHAVRKDLDRAEFLPGWPRDRSAPAEPPDQARGEEPP